MVEKLEVYNQELYPLIGSMRLAQRLLIKYVRTKFKLLSSISKRKAAEKAFQFFCTPQYRNKKRLPPVFEKAEKLRFLFEGNTIRGFRWKAPSPDHKKALILHGFESTVVNFDRYINPLVRKGYEVLAFDAPAHGRSGGSTITLPAYKNLVHYIWDHYGPLDAFIGHSLGGLTVALALEEIPHAASTRLVLIAPAAETTTAIDNFFKFLQLDKAVRREFDHLIEEMGGRPPEWYSLARIAPKLKARVLLLQDKDDRMTPISDVEPVIEKNYPNFHFVISEGLGHRRIYRDSGSLKAILDFL
jgi:pimeloyl-ACP methyl ester carboxylesterase